MYAGICVDFRWRFLVKFPLVTAGYGYICAVVECSMYLFACPQITTVAAGVTAYLLRCKTKISCIHWGWNSPNPNITAFYFGGVQGSRQLELLHFRETDLFLAES
jgi:hypothetical protein